MIAVVRLEPGDQWDQNMLDRLLAGELYPHSVPVEYREPWPDADGIVLIVPGRYWHDRCAEITAEITRYRWVLAVRTGDEESLLDISKIEHPNLRWWVQTPRWPRDRAAHRLLPLGYPPHFNDLPAVTRPDKNLRVFLSAQNSHPRRHEAFEALATIDRARMPMVVRETGGFAQGMPPDEYAFLMATARVAPAPAGAVCPESFRVYEALESHTIPIADDLSPVYDSRGYWTMLFPDTPFPTLTRYSDLPGYLEDALADYPRLANRVAAWWIGRKRRLAGWLRTDLAALGADVPPQRSLITVVISVSPIPSHPSSDILEATIASVRAQLPDSEIIIACDGVRAEQEHRRHDYEKFLQRLLWIADHLWHNVFPLIFDNHLHQAECARQALDHLDTPLLLFVEHDTPLIGEIPWTGLSDAIMSGVANVVRLHHESSILEPHKHLMLDDTPQDVSGVPMMRTFQWSQRPHLASASWYRGMLDRVRHRQARTFVEDIAHGLLIEDVTRDRSLGWYGWRTWIFTPPGSIQRSYHTDGRSEEPKYD
ncbi:hypothetical protein NDR87_26430 [Nocardia sp. CDC159]|uniref:Uncharacterized protein n=1 Tax=Nocardia pulmonis TaxID=2951408 RepID=A0A9X2IYH0_9NOCA|nr:MULTISPECIES: hypothetical protein [Nocardia]MCM6774985.1 hypothetical protein [Nocardia pulmonis]MCM6789916.1 hypothetical protein [Nocardia sp. CDC159]